MQVGDTLFTVVSVESDRARERLYDKVKRMILNDENTETPPRLRLHKRLCGRPCRYHKIHTNDRK
ncbi:MAG: hypothetical protein ACOX1U_00955 [Saccharofermentanales bacterium]